MTIRKHLSVNHASTYSILVSNLDLRLPMEQNGVISYVNTCYPNQLVLENCIHVNMTCPTVWEPNLKPLSEQKTLVTNNSDVQHYDEFRQTLFVINRICEVMSVLTKVSSVFVDDTFLYSLKSFVSTQVI